MAFAEFSAHGQGNRVKQLLGNGPEIWLRMQQTLDLWELERSRQEHYTNIKPVELAA